jgi:hypothetical protein
MAKFVKNALESQWRIKEKNKSLSQWAQMTHDTMPINKLLIESLQSKHFAIPKFGWICTIHPTILSSSSPLSSIQCILDVLIVSYNN